MKTFKQLVSEIYEPNTPDEGRFINMHTIRTFDYPVKNENGLPFKDERVKAPGPQHKKPATYDPPKEPSTVYSKANEEKENDRDDDETVDQYLNRGGKVTKGKAKTAKGISYMRGMSRQKGSSSAAKMAYKEEADIMNEAEDKPEEVHAFKAQVSKDEGPTKIVRLHVKMKSPSQGHDIAAKHLEKQGYTVHQTYLIGKVSPLFAKPVNEGLEEKKLTPAEMKKREEVAKAIQRENPKMPMAMKMAIATKTAKRVAEDTTFETDDILSLLQIVSDTDTPAEIFLEDDSDSIVIDKDTADLLLNVYESLDEEEQEKFEYALTDTNEGFEYCVNFSIRLVEEDIN